MVSNVGFVMIGQDAKTKTFWVHERENNDGKPGKVGLMADGSGDVRPTINAYVKNGYAPERIIYNGQPVTDVFTKTTDNEGNVVFKGSQKGIMQKGGNPFDGKYRHEQLLDRIACKTSSRGKSHGGRISCRRLPRPERHS